MANLLNNNATIPRLVCVFFLLFSFSQAREFLLDGKHDSWKIPSSYDEFTNWAQRLRFQIGDSLIVEYDKNSESILEVSEEAYKSCNKSNPIKSYKDGKTFINLYRSGWFFFISGSDLHCERGQKMSVDVLSAKHSLKDPSHQSLSPPPSSAKFGGAPALSPVAASGSAHGLLTNVSICVLGLLSFLLMAIIQV